mmetsp:Transcript_7285/g.6811  ORF Transcript_7285/g.6811 Transcript_7285/m.6811 type:complete len:93 (-) Transcript_7285:36-314(-)
MKDKKRKEDIEKQVIEEQARLWEKDREEFANQEKNMKEKAKQMTRQNLDLLQQQIEAHKEPKGMDEMEYMLNKGYLKGIRQKKHQILKETKV